MARALEITILRRRGNSHGSEQIIVTQRDGTTSTYTSLNEVPVELVPLIKPVLDRLASPSSTWAESQPEKPARRRVRRKDKKLVIEHPWIEFLPILGALVVWLWPLYACRDQLLGRLPWTLWTVLGIMLSLMGAYWFFAFLINRTTLTVTRDGIDIRHGPLPWPGNRFLAAAELVQLYVQVHRRRHTSYSLCALTTGKPQRLIADVRDPVSLRRYEEQIEQFLGIPDWPVPGNQYR